MWKKIVRFRTLLILFVLGFYCAVLLRNLNEAGRRSLTLRDDTDATDHVVISVLVTGVNPATQELTAQISLRPRGALAKDEVTPAVDLELLTNNVRSQQEFDFPQGKRMNRIEAVFPSERGAEQVSVRSLRYNVVAPDDHARTKGSATGFERSGRHRK